MKVIPLNRFEPVSVAHDGQRYVVLATLDHPYVETLEWHILHLTDHSYQDMCVFPSKELHIAEGTGRVHAVLDTRLVFHNRVPESHAEYRPPIKGLFVTTTNLSGREVFEVLPNGLTALVAPRPTRAGIECHVAHTGLRTIRRSGNNFAVTGGRFPDDIYFYLDAAMPADRRTVVAAAAADMHCLAAFSNGTATILSLPTVDHPSHPAIAPDGLTAACLDILDRAVYIIDLNT